MAGDNIPKGLHTDSENCKECFFVMCSSWIACSRYWMVKLKVCLLVFHGIPSTFVSSTGCNLFPFSCFLMNIINSFELVFHFQGFKFFFSKIKRDWMQSSDASFNVSAPLEKSLSYSECLILLTISGLISGWSSRQRLRWWSAVASRWKILLTSPKQTLVNRKLSFSMLSVSKGPSLDLP